MTETLIRTDNLGPLHDLMLMASPAVDGRKTITGLAKATGYSTGGLYKAIRQNRITLKAAVAIMRVAEGRVESNDFMPYLDEELHYFVSGIKPA